MREKKSAEHGTHGKRKRWSAAEKLRIVLQGMKPGVGVSDVCRREGLNPTMYYQWKRTLLGAAERIFEKKETKPTVPGESTNRTRSRDGSLTSGCTGFWKRETCAGTWSAASW